MQNSREIESSRMDEMECLCQGKIRSYSFNGSVKAVEKNVQVFSKKSKSNLYIHGDAHDNYCY